MRFGSLCSSGRGRRSYRILRTRCTRRFRRVTAGSFRFLWQAIESKWLSRFGDETAAETPARAAGGDGAKKNEENTSC